MCQTGLLVTVAVFDLEMLFFLTGDLESQVLDLHEANETSSAEVLRLDQENQMLTAHIKRLSANLDNDTETERQILQQQVHTTCRADVCSSLDLNITKVTKNVTWFS